ncbi:MAG: tRNA pseudouridine(55) synthase TruB, partial [Coriobacteriaceae bacterium]|nr:tRNA pseudouridine(55) synthase TruB [Coriobacteriaceae bacterium]
LGMVTLDDKRYRARISFGSETSTDDAEGEVVRTAPVDDRFTDEGFAVSALASLVGDHMQVPPAYSAISVDGARAYALARKGEDVELAARPITVLESELVEISHDVCNVTWTCDFHVSKGTYIRSLARDLGKSLGTAAHLAGLERTSSGSISLDSCMTLDELAGGGLDAALGHMLDPLSALPYPSLRISADELADVLNGRHIRLPKDACDKLADRSPVCLVRDGKLWGIWERRCNSLASRSNFPSGIEGVER